MNKTSKMVAALYSEGIPIKLPPRFTGSADTKVIDKALRVVERGNKALSGEEAVIVYRVLSGYGGIEKFHRVCAESRAGEITHDWLKERKTAQWKI